VDHLNDQNLPNVYGKDAEYYFNNFQKLLKLNNFNLNIISSYYFFQINRWDLVTNDQKIIKFPSKGLEEAIKVAKKLLNNKDFDKYSVIDLRINNKIIIQ
jgi:cell division septal protein FtsQ